MKSEKHKVCNTFFRTKQVMIAFVHHEIYIYIYIFMRKYIYASYIFYFLFILFNLVFRLNQCKSRDLKFFSFKKVTIQLFLLMKLVSLILLYYR